MNATKDAEEGLKDELNKLSPEGQSKAHNRLLYKIGEAPDFYWTVFLAFQQCLMCIGISMSVPLLISGLLCAADNYVLQAELLSGTLFMAGFSTIIMVWFGIRLPVLQGPQGVYVASIVVMMATRSCPTTVDNGILRNVTDGTLINGSITESVGDPEWQLRIREVSGSLMVASVIQSLLAGFGLIGFMMRFIGPLTLVPTLVLVVLSLKQPVISICEQNWIIALSTAALIMILANYLGNIQIPCPAYDKHNGIHFVRLPVLKMIPIMLSILIVWIVLAILTATNVIPPGREERTDYKMYAVAKASWFRVPYPGRFGMPTFSAGGLMAMLSSVILTILDSIADYHSTAIVANVPAPPDHALNRGIVVEGVASILSGAVGTCHGTTTYAAGIATIAITRIASRRVFYVTGFFLMAMGVFGKFGAFLNTIPVPIVGGVSVAYFGMCISVSLSYLQFVDMRSPRNMMVLGIAIMAPYCFCDFIKNNPAYIKTGIKGLDDVLVVVMSSEILISVVLGCFLDNTVPGNDHERGIKKWRDDVMASTDEDDEEDSRSKQQILDDLYDIPYVTSFIKKLPFTRFFPICPGYDTKSWEIRRCTKRRDRIKNQTNNLVNENGEGTIV